MFFSNINTVTYSSKRKILTFPANILHVRAELRGQRDKNHHRTIIISALEIDDRFFFISVFGVGTFE